MFSLIIPLCSFTGLQLSVISFASSHSASSFGFPMVADNPMICASGISFFISVITISSVGPLVGSFIRCISSIITTPVFFSHGEWCLIIESS